MPRINNSLYTPKYRAKDFTDLVKSKMAINGISQKDIAEQLHITQQAFSAKLASSSYSLTDIIEIFQVIKPTDEEMLKVMRY